MSMGRYEIIFILAPNTPEDTMNGLVARFEADVTGGEGVLLRVEKWGRKKLAYDVRKFREGYFVLFVVDCQGSLVTELERRFRMTDQVIKFMTVRVDEELKRAGKMPKDEELGKARETERIDRSRRSGVKPVPRAGASEDDGADSDAEGTGAEEDDSADADTAETASHDADRDAASGKPAAEADVELAAGTAEPVDEDEDGAADDDNSEEK